MNEAYLAGRGLASALGPDLGSGLIALARGGVAPRRLQLPGGAAWPLHALAYGADRADGASSAGSGAQQDANWTARARQITQRVAAASGVLAGPRTGPLFLASSSLDIGAREDSSDFHVAFGDASPVDYQSFAETVASWLDWRGPVFTVSTACTSGLNALLSARTLIRHGHADHALVLGLELRNRVTIGGFGGMQLLSATRAQPFGRARNGVVLGEAVAALYLSCEPSRWRIAGGANVVNGQDPAGSVPGAVVAMCRQALADSALEPRQIALIKLQAAGSRVGDATEARALRQVFEPLPALVSLKAAIGHTLGAAGAAEIALLTACLETGVWPQCDYAQDAALNAPLAPAAPEHARYVLASILGFGGGHAAVVLEDRAA